MVQTPAARAMPRRSHFIDALARPSGRCAPESAAAFRGRRLKAAMAAVYMIAQVCGSQAMTQGEDDEPPTMVTKFWMKVLCTSAMLGVAVMMINTLCRRTPAVAHGRCLDARPLTLEAEEQSNDWKMMKDEESQFDLGCNLVYVAPRSGKRFHKGERCQGLRKAQEVRKLEPCPLCFDVRSRTEGVCRGTASTSQML